MMTKRNIIILILLHVHYLLTANVGQYYQGSGGLVFPVKSNAIRMVQETIDIYVFENSQGREQVFYNCHFELENMKTSKQMVKIGFPIEYSTGYFSLEKVLGRTNITYFGVQVAGKRVQFQRYLHGMNPELKNIKGYHEVIVFSADFNPGEKKSINIVYLEEVVSDTQGTSFDLRYILKTGSTWKEKIEEAKITVYFYKPCNIREITPGEYIVLENPQRITFHLNNFIPEKDIKITYSFKDRSAEQNLNLSHLYNQIISVEWIPLTDNGIMGQVENFLTDISRNTGNLDYINPALIAVAYLLKSSDGYYRTIDEIKNKTQRDILTHYFNSCLNTVVEEKPDNFKEILSDIEAYVTNIKYFEDKIMELSDGLWKNKKKEILLKLKFIIEDMFELHKTTKPVQFPWAFKLNINKNFWLQNDDFDSNDIEFNNYVREVRRKIRYAYYSIGYYYYYKNCRQAITYYTRGLKYANSNEKFISGIDDLSEAKLEEWEDEGEGDKNAAGSYLAYNICCCYTKLSDFENAFRWLSVAVRLHYPHKDWLFKDPDTEGLRNYNINKFRETVEK